MDEPMLRADLRPGLAVGNINPEQRDGRDDGSPLQDWLPDGHPGRVRQVHDGMHVLIDWVGREDEEVSLSVGWGCDDRGILMPGLARLTDDEFDARAAEAMRQHG